MTLMKLKPFEHKNKTNLSSAITSLCYIDSVLTFASVSIPRGNKKYEYDSYAAK